ncbi:hypothetical protein PSHT_14573 [Puccinia striiformis]|uniref:Uncharacterized protein n=1 Tax=Puccinia striiformis TaxID=27350 RepID=A0A2S4UJJ3_9BASI|nr:hypothetical protein PSHT_14573 [Puccinia striiformis]
MLSRSGTIWFVHNSSNGVCQGGTRRKRPNEQAARSKGTQINTWNGVAWVPHRDCDASAQSHGVILPQRGATLNTTYGAVWNRWVSNTRHGGGGGLSLIKFFRLSLVGPILIASRTKQLDSVPRPFLILPISLILSTSHPLGLDSEFNDTAHHHVADPHQDPGDPLLNTVT